MGIALKRWDSAEHLKTEEDITLYLEACFDEAGDDAALTEWLVIEKDEDNKVFVPWDEIAVRWPLLKHAA